jgi:hypothetical protein
MGGVRGTPLDLSSFLFLTLSSLSVPYSLISSTSTGGISSDVVVSWPQNLQVLQAGIKSSIGPNIPLTGSLVL